MRKLLLLLLFSLSGGVLVSAQDTSTPPVGEKNTKPYEEQSFSERLTNWDNKDRDTKFEFRLGWLGDIEPPYYLKPAKPQKDWYGLGYDYHEALEQEGRIITHVSPQLYFMRHTSRHISLGMRLYYANRRQNIYNTVTSQVSQSLRVDIFTLSPTVKWDIIRGEWFRFYLSTGFNIYFSNDKHTNTHCDLETFAGYGYTVGKRVFFFMDGTVDSSGVTNTMGIGYRF